MGISLDKVAQQAPELLSLAKNAAEALNRHGLENSPARVALCLDYSGSMRNRYQSGEVQALAERALAIATQFDDDGNIDVFAFDSSAVYLGELNLSNYKGGIDRLLSGRRMGTTAYHDAFKLVSEHYFPGQGLAVKLGGLFGKKQAVSSPDLPVFTVFVTDGVPDDKRAAEQTLKDASKLGIFWKFLSVGNESIPFLEKLDDMDGRVIDNADYKAMGSDLVARMNDQGFFDLLVEEYIGWLGEARRRGMIG